MKKDSKVELPESSEPLKQENATSENNVQGGANSSYPREYEEHRSEEIRMKPQPLDMPEKSEDEQTPKQ